MTEKIGHIKNPLTIIAVFAGLAEVGGTIVLPLLQPPVQSTYVWFLMLFPSVLVSIFFFVLYRKHHVLYSPSDYRDDATFRGFIQVQAPSASIQALEPSPQKASSAQSVENQPTEPTPGVDAPLVFAALRPSTRKILKTLWTNQQEHFPDQAVRWGFGVGPGASDYLSFSQGLNEGVRLGLMAVRDQFCYLSDVGIAFCRQNLDAINSEPDMYCHFTNVLSGTA